MGPQGDLFSRKISLISSPLTKRMMANTSMRMQNDYDEYVSICLCSLICYVDFCQSSGYSVIKAILWWTECVVSVNTAGSLCAPCTQVQGQALLPGAAMFEMASSAASTLQQSAVGSAAHTTAALLQVTIPAPLPLVSAADAAPGASWAAAAMLAVSVDVGSGRLTVLSQQGAALTPCTHLTAMATGLLPQTSVRPLATASSRQQPTVLAALIVWKRADEVGAATADVEQPANGQSSQFNVHPAVLDCTTQVITATACLLCHVSGMARHT